MTIGPKIPPTHILRVEVPLNLDDRPYDYDAVADAIKLALSISRAGFAGHICDEPQVNLEETGTIGQMDRFDIEEKADPKDRMMLACSSAATAFGYALKRGWITEAGYDAAKERSGRLWNYCGD